MISLPWYLLAIGIALVVLGVLAASVPSTRDRGRRRIDAKMRDKDIVRQLKRDEQIPISGYVILAGFACIVVSVAWRIVRVFL